MREYDPSSGSELLVQRFIDQELSGEERIELLVQLGRDQALRERLIELERLMLGVADLPRPAATHEFVARVMERTAERPSAWQRAIDALWAPHAFRWNLAGATALAALLVAGALSARSLMVPPASTPAPVAAAPAGPSPVLVRLVVLQPDAMSVALAGDFNGWDPMRTPLEQTSSGAWTVTIPLEPGRYEYMFVVDGKEWIADPFAVEQSDDGFGSRNAVLDVRPPMEASL
ncbi:MAG TPA: isoamylase early set domain-containing protein [Vicinamibacterales bacterium]|nr:isoamylase early set domain-containing protein [Vicinamibacterales bacterium]